MPDRDSVPEHEANVQQAFDRVAGELGLRPEPAPGPGEVRTVGELFFIAFHKIVDVETDPAAPPVGAADDAAIQAVLNGSYSHIPADLKNNWQSFFHDPFEAIGRTFIVRMDGKAIRKWVKSPELAQRLQEYPPFNPRHVQITNVNIVYIGNVRAAVTYHVQEDFQNSTVAAGNSLVLMVKLQNLGWRILIITKEEMATSA